MSTTYGILPNNINNKLTMSDSNIFQPPIFEIASKENYKMSVIISTYSSERYNDLITLINSLLNQTYSNFEIILIIDENVELLRKISDYILTNEIDHPIHIKLNPSNRGLSYSRNLGITYSSGDIIGFIDDDAIPDKNWISQIIHIYESEPNCGSVVGDVIPKWENEEMGWFPRELHWMISCSYILTPYKKQEVERGFGVNMSFRRDVLINVGAFNTNLGINGKRWIGGEDTDMFLRVKDAGNLILYNPEAKVHHLVNKNRITLRNVVKRSFNGGKSVWAMKVITNYRLQKSTENKYLSVLIKEFYPNSIKKMIFSPSKHIGKQVFYVSTVVIFEILGFLVGLVENSLTQ